jgi:hypothetical protein
MVDTTFDSQFFDETMICFVKVLFIMSSLWLTIGSNQSCAYKCQ